MAAVRIWIKKKKKMLNYVRAIRFGFQRFVRRFLDLRRKKKTQGTYCGTKGFSQRPWRFRAIQKNNRKVTRRIRNTRVFFISRDVSVVFFFFNFPIQRFGNREKCASVIKFRILGFKNKMRTPSVSIALFRPFRN